MNQVRRRPRISRHTRDENVAGYLFMLPWLIGLVVIVGGPFLASLYFSFTKYSILGTPKWIGLANYVRMFTNDPRFWQSLRVTFTYLIGSVPAVQVMSLGLALLLNRGIRGLAIYRSVFYIPSLIGGSVAIAILWRFLFQANGLLNNILATVGIHVQTSWIGQPATALWTLVILNVWQFGAPMIIYLAGLRQIPVDLYEAATVDGAGAFQKFIRITLPMLSPVILFNVLMNIVSAFQAFNSAYIVSNGSGGPASSTLFYTLYIYQNAFINFDMGYASALGWVLLLVSAVFAAVLFGFSRRLVYYGG